MYKYVMILILSIFSILDGNAQSNASGAIASQAHTTNNALLNDFLVRQGFQKIPVQEINGLLYLQGTIAGIPSYFLLDSGSNTYSILSDGIERLKLTPSQSDQKTANSTGGVNNVKTVKLSQIKIATIHLNEITAGIMEQPFKNKLPTVVLGTEFFERYNVILDTSNKNIFVRTQALTAKDKFKLNELIKKTNFTTVPLTELASNHFILPVQINKESPSYFLFDTGFGSTTLSIAYSKELKLAQGNYVQESATDGSITTANTLLKQITFNPLQTFFDKPIQLENVEAYSANIESLVTYLGVNGVIGLTEMEKLHTIIDFSSKRAYFKQ